MHAAARQFVQRALAVKPNPRSVVELGSLNINGGVRDLLPRGVPYVGVDLQDGPGVDIVADATKWRPETPPDLVLCLEVLEHATNARGVIVNALRMLAPGGLLVVTAAMHPRAPHSAYDGGELRDGEYYRNVTATTLLTWLHGCIYVVLEADRRAGDVRAAALKGE